MPAAWTQSLNPLFILVFTYSAAYLPAGKGNVSFYTLMTSFTMSILLLALANDVILLFLAWELVSLASFMLIARSGKAGEAGSQRTLILTFIGGLTLLAAVAIAATAAGTTNLEEILASGVWAQRPGLTAGVAVLIACSAFTKAAQFPVHFWLPEALSTRLHTAHSHRRNLGSSRVLRASGKPTAWAALMLIPTTTCVRAIQAKLPSSSRTPTQSLMLVPVRES